MKWKEKSFPNKETVYADFWRETEYKRELEEYITIMVLAPILFGRTVFIACFTTLIGE